MQRVRSRYIDLKVAAGFAADAGTYGFQIGSLFIGATCVGRLCFTYWGPDATFDPHHLRIMAQVENVSEIFRILTRFVSAHAKRPPQSGLVQVAFWEVDDWPAKRAKDRRSGRNTASLDIELRFPERLSPGRRRSPGRVVA